MKESIPNSKIIDSRIYVVFKCKECKEEMTLVDEWAIECPKCGKRYILDIYESPYQPNAEE